MEEGCGGVYGCVAVSLLSRGASGCRLGIGGIRGVILVHGSWSVVVVRGLDMRHSMRLYRVHEHVT